MANKPKPTARWKIRKKKPNYVYTNYINNTPKLIIELEAINLRTVKPFNCKEMEWYILIQPNITITLAVSYYNDFVK